MASRVSSTETTISSSPKPQLATEKVSTQRSTVPTVEASTLIDGGFKKIGEWKLVGDQIQLVGEVPDIPGVYAKIADGEVVYIGVATMGLKKRLYFYSRPGKSQSTNIRLKKLITEQLESGVEIEVLAASPEPGRWNSLPVDFVTGLEAGLIRRFRPAWNL